MACWKAFHNANRIHAGIQMSFFELVYEPGLTVQDMRAGDELIIVAPNGTRSSGRVVAAGQYEIAIKDASGSEWILTETTEAERDQCVIYSDMLNTIWTVRQRRPSS